MPKGVRGFQKGIVTNPNGRPKGKTMKEFAREFLIMKTDEEKIKWLKKIDDETIWKMAEGHPHQTTDITSKGKPIPIFGNVSNNNSNKEDSPTEETD